MTNYCKYCGLSTCCCPSPDELREMATVLEGIDTQSMGLPRPAGQHVGAPGRVARDAGLRRPFDKLRAGSFDRLPLPKGQHT